MRSQGLSSSNLISIAAAAVAIAAAAYSMGGRAHLTHPSVAYVDFQMVLQQSDAGKSIAEQIAPRQKKMQDEAEAKLKELKSEQEGLAKLQGADKTASAAALQKKIDDWNAEAQKRQTALTDVVNPAVLKVDKVLREQVQIIAEENKFSSVLPVAVAVYAGKDVDITSEAMRRLNNKLSKVEVEFKDK